MGGKGKGREGKEGREEGRKEEGIHVAQCLGAANACVHGLVDWLID